MKGKKCRTSDNLHCVFYDVNSTSIIKNKKSALCIRTRKNVDAGFWCSFYLEVK